MLARPDRLLDDDAGDRWQDGVQRRFEADHGLRLGLWPICVAHLVEQARRRELGIRREALANDRVIRLELGPPGRLRASQDRSTRHRFRDGLGSHRLDRSSELAGLDPMVNHSATDAEALRDVGLVETFIQEMLEQHEGVPSEHDARARRRDVEWEGPVRRAPSAARTAERMFPRCAILSVVFEQNHTGANTAVFRYIEKWYNRKRRHDIGLSHSTPCEGRLLDPPFAQYLIALNSTTGVAASSVRSPPGVVVPGTVLVFRGARLFA